MNKTLLLAEQVRSQYIAGFLSFVKTFMMDYPKSIVEIGFKSQRDGQFLLDLFRLDVGSKNEEGAFIAREVELENQLEFQPFKEIYQNDLTISVISMVWNSIEVEVDTTWESCGTLLEQWASKWMDIEDEHHPDVLGLQNVIHSVVGLRKEKNFTGFSVDFGSAPVESLQELLSLLHNVGATFVKLS